MYEDVLVVEARLVINQVNLTLEQVAAKMQSSHLDLLRLLTDDLKHAGAPERAVGVLHSLASEQGKVDPEWFNSADNFGKATERALKKQREVYATIGKPLAWGLNEESNFEDETTKDNVEERWKRTSKMRAVAQMAARLGQHGFEPAISLLRMALNPTHLRYEGMPAVGRQTSLDAPPGTTDENKRILYRKKTSLKESIRDKMDITIRKSLKEASLSETDVEIVDQKDWDMLRIAYYILKEGTVQPWPPLLVHALARLSKPEYLQAFIQLFKLVLTPAEYENPFKLGASVLFFHKQEPKLPPPPVRYASSAFHLAGYKHATPARWEIGRIHHIEVDEAGGTRTFDVLLRGTEVVSELEPKHVLYVGLAGVGALLREAARQGCTKLLKCMLDANISPFYCDRHANTALMEAAREKHADACRLLIVRGLDEHVFNRSRENAFDVAVGHRDGTILHAMVPSKSDLEMYKDEGLDHHPLHCCVSMDSEHDVLKQLEHELDGTNAPDVNTPTAGGERTALMIAARSGQLATVQKLLKCGADVGMQGVTDCGRLGSSAVSIAAEHGHDPILRCAYTLALSRT